ncbi:hypothetical protein F5Y08DRAFT_330340 [Xylaria arbuscula]|nr:hypothetical protein F5Y08DRAFT_330340 [Xylaria arbuscula]
MPFMQARRPVYLADRSIANFTISADQQRQQWSEPTDVFSVLLLLGGEIVNKALAQLAGGSFTPVTFSFGWVSYAVTMLLASVGEAKLMPRAADGECLVVTAKSGYTRGSTSWVVSRIFHDYEAWMHPATRARLKVMLDDRECYMRRNARAGTKLQRPSQTGLCIAIYEPSQSSNAGEPKRDFIYWSGILVTFIQLVVAAIPFATRREWIVFLITICGTALALITGSLPQWREEKWACRRNTHSTYILTQGNGTQHAIAILGNGRGLNLEDLAIDSQRQYNTSNCVTRFTLAATALLWICLLIVGAGVSTNTWYLLGVGIMGMVQNVLTVGWRRDPSALGVHLDFRGVIALETKHSGLGRCLLPMFFPGELLPEENLAWEALEATKTREEEERRKRENHESSRADHPKEGWVAHARNFETSSSKSSL